MLPPMFHGCYLQSVCLLTTGCTGLAVSSAWLPVWLIHPADRGNLWARLYCAYSSVPTLALCEFEGCLSPLPLGEDLPCSLCHVSCWVRDTCGTCSPLMLQLTHPLSDDQAAATLHDLYCNRPGWLSRWKPQSCPAWVSGTRNLRASWPGPSLPRGLGLTILDTQQVRNRMPIS